MYEVPLCVLLSVALSMYRTYEYVHIGYTVLVQWRSGQYPIFLGTLFDCATSWSLSNVPVVRLPPEVCTTGLGKNSRRDMETGATLYTGSMVAVEQNQPPASERQGRRGDFVP